MQTIYLDTSSKGVVPTIYAKQGDIGRKFEVIFTNSGLPYTIPADSVFSVWYSGESGEGNYTNIGDNSAFYVNENKVTVELITQMLTNEGSGILCLVLNESNGNQIGSWNIPYLCEKVPGIESEAAKEYYTAFSKTVESLKQVTENLTPEAIGAAPAGFGLGKNAGGSWVNDFNSAVTNGWFNNSGGSANAPWAHGGMIFVNAYNENLVRQIAYTDYYNWTAVRWKIDGVWQPWDHVNPPMLPGAEYRTTERWNGKAVYTQMRSGLSFPNANHRDIEFGINNSAKVIRYRHIAYGQDMCEMPMVSGTTVVAYGYFAQGDNGLVYRYKTSTDLTSYTESYIQAWYTKD